MADGETREGAGEKFSPKDERMMQVSNGTATLEAEPSIERPRTQVEMLLADLRGRAPYRLREQDQDTPEGQATPLEDTPLGEDPIYDIRDYFLHELKDVRKGEDLEIKRKRLKKLLKTVVKLTAYETIKPGQRDSLISHIDEQFEDWGRQANALPEASDERSDAEANQGIFAQFRNTVYGRAQSDRDRAEARAGKPMDKQASEAIVKELIRSPEEFAQYKIALTNTRPALKEIGETADKITPEQLLKVYEELGIDINAQEQHNEQDPKWRAKRAIVESAIKFFHEEGHKDDPEAETESIIITVAQNSDGHVEYTSDWRSPANAEEAFGVFKLNPQGDEDDPESLSHHIYGVNQFHYLRRSLSSAQTALQRLAEKAEDKSKISVQERMDIDLLRKRFFGEKDDEIQGFIDEHTTIDYSLGRKKRSVEKKGGKKEGKKERKAKTDKVPKDKAT